MEGQQGQLGEQEQGLDQLRKAEHWGSQVYHESLAAASQPLEVEVVTDELIRLATRDEERQLLLKGIEWHVALMELIEHHR